MKTYTVGILGFGFIGKVHAYAHLTMPLYYPQSDFRTRITHIGTSAMATAKKGCTQIQAKVPVTDYREITENPEIDIVHINDLDFAQATADRWVVFCEGMAVADGSPQDLLNDGQLIRAGAIGNSAELTACAHVSIDTSFIIGNTPLFEQ